MTRIKWIFAMAVIVATVFAFGFITLNTGIRPSFAAGPDEKHVSGTNVKIDNFSFGPAAITIPVGATVTWTNNDDVPHVVTSDDNKLFKSKALDTDDRFSFTFTKPGTYNYYCAIHPKMTAKIVVR